MTYNALFLIYCPLKLTMSDMNIFKIIKNLNLNNLKSEPFQIFFLNYEHFSFKYFQKLSILKFKQFSNQKYFLSNK
jgi:hypothetical protein